MENAIKDQKVTEVMQLIDQLVQKEKDKNAEQLERLYKLDNAVMSLTCDIREALCFIRPMIDTAVSYSPYDNKNLNGYTHRSRDRRQYMRGDAAC